MGKVYILVHQAVYDHQSIGSAPLNASISLTVEHWNENILVREMSHIAEHVAASITFHIFRGQAHVPLGVARVIEKPISDGSTGNGAFEYVRSLSQSHQGEVSPIGPAVNGNSGHVDKISFKCQPFESVYLIIDFHLTKSLIDVLFKVHSSVLGAS